MKSVMVHEFSQAPTITCPRSRFDRSCGYKTTFDSGYLVPFFVDEVLPGDTFDVDATLFARMTTPIVPIMDNVFLDTFFFFVPYRLVWSHFVNFMGEQANPDDSTDYLIPQLKSTTTGSGDDEVVGFQPQSLYDYMGIPVGVSGLSFSALPLRAYNLIWNQWFRDENLQNSVPVTLGDSGDSLSDYTLLRRGKRHDYFTSCLPWPQKGPGVELPIGDTAPVVGTGQTLGWTDGRTASGSLSYDGNSLFGTAGYFNDTAATAFTLGRYSVTSGVDDSVSLPHSGSYQNITTNRYYGVTKDPRYSGLIADLSAATAVTINSLRQAFQLQKYYEKDARGGTRYIEKILAHFGVKSPDARLQRTEYLGGNSSKLIVNQVEQNSATSNVSPQGNLSAYAYFASGKNGFTRSFTEHGIVIGLCNVRADLTYQQGLDRFWSRRTPVDFYWPTFAHLGEQAVLNKEIYAQGEDVVDEQSNIIDEKVYGYQERSAEYRYKPSKVTGKLRSTVSGSLDVWHLSQKFENLPVLNSEFIEDNPPFERVLAVQNEPQFILDCYIKNVCVRPMPVYSIPGLVDHF